jgi:DNA replication protein DnaC
LSHFPVLKTQYQEEWRCKICNNEFLTDVSEYTNGKVLRANICDQCAKQRDARDPIAMRNEKRKQIWDRMVGPYYYTFDPDRLPQAISGHVEEAFLWHPDSARGVGFLGRSRTGKSRVLFELGRKLFIQGHDVYPTSGIEFAEKVSGQVNDREDFEQYINRVKNCKVLILDDADKCRFTESVEAAYYGMLEYRRRFQKPILVSVNCSGAQMKAQMGQNNGQNRGEPIVNRLRDLCEIIELK